MSSLVTLKILQIYGIAIAISMLVAVIIKLLVLVTGRLNKPAAVKPAPPATGPLPTPSIQPGIPQEVVAAISAALAVVTGPHRILHIATSQTSWAAQGRSAQHSHQPRHK